MDATKSFKSENANATNLSSVNDEHTDALKDNENTPDKDKTKSKFRPRLHGTSDDDENDEKKQKASSKLPIGIVA